MNAASDPYAGRCCATCGGLLRPPGQARRLVRVDLDRSDDDPHRVAHADCPTYRKARR